MRTHTRTRKVLVALAATATAGAVVGLVAPAHADTTFTRTIADPSLTGAAFSTTGNVTGDVRPEIVATGYGTYTVVAGVAAARPGHHDGLRERRQEQEGRLHRPAGRRSSVFDRSANIVFPSQAQSPTSTVTATRTCMHGGGFFWDSNLGINRGTLTWWENRANGKKWIRHSIETDSPGGVPQPRATRTSTVTASRTSSRSASRASRRQTSPTTSSSWSSTRVSVAATSRPSVISQPRRLATRSCTTSTVTATWTSCPRSTSA